MDSSESYVNMAESCQDVAWKVTKELSHISSSQLTRLECKFKTVSYMCQIKCCAGLT